MLFIHTVFGAGRAFYSSVQIWILGIPDNAVQKPWGRKELDTTQQLNNSNVDNEGGSCRD